MRHLLRVLSTAFALCATTLLLTLVVAGTGALITYFLL